MHADAVYLGEPVIERVWVVDAQNLYSTCPSKPDPTFLPRPTCDVFL
jgi:hypothetical protein